MKKEFPCDSCGLCCQNISYIPQLQHFDRGNGICIHLENNTCGIYNSRPDICQVNKMFELYFKYEMSWEEFVDENLKVCNSLKSKTL